MTIIERIILAMRLQKCKCAVIGLKYRGHQTIATEIEEVMFFRDYNDFRDWWTTMDNIFDPSERPVDAFVIHNI